MVAECIRLIGMRKTVSKLELFIWSIMLAVFPMPAILLEAALAVLAWVASYIMLSFYIYWNIVKLFYIALTI